MAGGYAHPLLELDLQRARVFEHALEACEADLNLRQGTIDLVAFVRVALAGATSQRSQPLSHVLDELFVRDQFWGLPWDTGKVADLIGCSRLPGRAQGDLHDANGQSPKVSHVQNLIKNTAEFAKALKDLDLGGTLLTVGILLIAIASITGGLDNVTEAMESIREFHARAWSIDVLGS
ncbi:hypothetical protein [Promicromonospora soli]